MRADEPLLFWSNEAQPVEEAQAMRDNVLAGFDGPVDYSPQDPSAAAFLTRIQAELEAQSGSIGIIGGLHGDFSSFADGLVDLSSVDTKGVANSFVDLAHLGTKEQKYIPWMQATYVMVANKKALEFLPAGVNINAMTYDQLAAWGKALAERTGSPKIGFPAGPRGLMHRFFEGYLYPSYTGKAVTEFRSKEAEAMWTAFRDLWQYVSPASTSYGFMQEPLLTEDVWVAWDHVARVKDALNQRPNDFVVFPVPAGPAGRGNMPVIAGLGVPTTSPNPNQAKRLITYMLKPETQIATLRATGFFPVEDIVLPDDVPVSARMIQPVVAAQATASDRITALLPTGLRDAGNRFNQVFTDSFQQIVLNGADIRETLEHEGEALQGIFNETGAPCWAPDSESEGACQLK
ncbi:ABC transporter substrate-binding protein [Mesorhizobium sp. M1233]|uniref:ABC transporter substrate-binding protein n=1 Tax=Mesorhizobium sp. M1233 TaxID=2957072 RepID=UPI0033369B9D